MRLTTKFDLGQEVHAIADIAVDIDVDDPFCEGTGQITGRNGKARRCPECQGRGKLREHHAREWRLAQPSPMHVGEIRVEVSESKTREIYMLDETGLGSGTLWPVNDLFAIRETAEAECRRRNARSETP